MTPFVASWGIIGCGWISSEFAKDISLVRDDVKDVYHSIAAVGSRDEVKAAKFIRDFCPRGGTGQQSGLVPALPEACGSYEEVYNHKDVNIIYIGTLNPSHYSDAKAALEHGKHCLVEKPACLNAAEWASLSKLAKEKNLFLMEAMWTRFLPLSYTLQHKLFNEKVIGDVKSVHADFGMAFYNTLPDTHRTMALNLAGGPMYDLGPYIVLPAILALFHNPTNEGAKPANVKASMLKARTGVDLTTAITLDFPKMDAKAVLSTSFAYNSPKDALCVIKGTKGQIVIDDGLSRITKMRIQQIDQEPTFWITKWKEDVKIQQNFEGFGLMYEADAVARSLRDGELENTRMPHAETAIVLEIFDEVRRQGDYVLPEGLEKLRS